MEFIGCRSTAVEASLLFFLALSQPVFLLGEITKVVASCNHLISRDPMGPFLFVDNLFKRRSGIRRGGFEVDGGNGRR